MFCQQKELRAEFLQALSLHKVKFLSQRIIKRRMTVHYLDYKQQLYAYREVNIETKLYLMCLSQADELERDIILDSLYAIGAVWEQFAAEIVHQVTLVDQMVYLEQSDHNKRTAKGRYLNNINYITSYTNMLNIVQVPNDHLQIEHRSCEAHMVLSKAVYDILVLYQS